MIFLYPEEAAAAPRFGAAHQEQPSWTRSPRNPRKPWVLWRISTTARPRRFSAPSSRILALTGRPWVGGAVYAPRAARFDDSARALSQDEMRRAAPSIFAARPHVSRSERFRAIPTIEVLRGLEKEGFFAVGVEAVGIAGRHQDGLHEAHDPAAPSRRCAKIPSRRRRLRNHLEERQRRHQPPTS